MEDKKRKKNKKLSPVDTDKNISKSLSNPPIEPSEEMNEIQQDGVLIEDEVKGVVIEHKTQPSLDDLLVDDESETVTKTLSEDSIGYESSLAEYQQLMHKALTYSVEEQEKNAQAEEEAEKNEEDFDESEFLISLPAVKPKNNENTRSEISLIPEEYAEFDYENEYLTDAPALEEDNAESAEEMLGQETVFVDGDNDFQLSFAFDEEKAGVKSEEPEEKTNEKYDPEKPRIIDYIFEFVELFVFTLAAVIILTSFVFKHSVVDGNSMYDTLEHGDHLIISDLFYTPERGDIIVFEDYSTFLKKAVVKRIIGLPGEVVEIKVLTRESYAIYIDGEFYEEYMRKSANHDEYHTGIWEVGEGEVFVLGDNRYDSTDSRHSGVGTIQIDTILGRALFRFFPFDKFGNVN